MLRQMGYLRDQEGIMNRYLREKSNWESHLERTKGFINGAFKEVPIRTVAVLGSGWLLDIPLTEMVGRYDRICLIDIHHPPQIRKKVSGLGNVELIEADLSGGAIGQLWQKKKRMGKFASVEILDSISLIPPLDQCNVDAYFSVNLLNQLDIILCDYLKKQGYFQQESPNSLRSRLQSFHLEWITTKPGCLIADTLEITTESSGNEQHKSLLHTDLPAGIRSENWTWEFDTTGSYGPGTLTRMEVQAIEWI